MPPNDGSFEEPLLQLRRRIEELEGYPEGSGHEREIARLGEELEQATTEVYGQLSRWQKTLVARNSERPYTLDYVAYLFTDWVEIHGDRTFGDEPSIGAGRGSFRGESVAGIGQAGVPELSIMKTVVWHSRSTLPEPPSAMIGPLPTTSTARAEGAAA